MSTTMIKAEPGNYVLSLKELDTGQMVLSKHPVIAFKIFPDYEDCNYVTLPITVMDLPRVQKPTLLTPDGIVYEYQQFACDLETHIECLSARHGDKLEFHVSMDRH
jgi:hypothetical protein